MRCQISSYANLSISRSENILSFSLIMQQANTTRITYTIFLLSRISLMRKTQFIATKINRTSAFLTHWHKEGKRGARINLRRSLQSIRCGSLAVSYKSRNASRGIGAVAWWLHQGYLRPHRNWRFGELSWAAPRSFVIGSLYAEPCAERKMYAYIVFTARRGRCAQTRRGLSNAGRSWARARVSLPRLHRVATQNPNPGKDNFSPDPRCMTRSNK